MDSATWAAWASTVAAFFSLGITVAVVFIQARLGLSIEDKKQQRENRRKILVFIEDLSDALGSVYAMAIFSNLDIPENSAVQIRNVITGIARYEVQFANAREALVMFDEEASKRLNSALRGVRDFSSACTRLAEELEHGVDSVREQRIFQSFAYSKGSLQTAIAAVGMDLVHYGATRYSWHGGEQYGGDDDGGAD